jgi:hypothetical protein
MVYVLYFLAAIGALFIIAALVRFVGFKRLSVGLEFHNSCELSESSEVHPVNASQNAQPLLRNGKVTDGKFLDE